MQQTTRTRTSIALEQKRREHRSRRPKRILLADYRYHTILSHDKPFSEEADIKINRTRTRNRLPRRLSPAIWHSHHPHSPKIVHDTIMMRAVQCHAFSALETTTTTSLRPRPQPSRLRDVLSLTRLPRPLRTAHSDEVLIRTSYVGVQYPDALQAQGLFKSARPCPTYPAWT
jgi:hypothetical protein